MIESTLTLDTLRAENVQLRQALTLYRSLIDQLALGVFIYKLENCDDDRTLRMMLANPAVEALTGVPPAEQVGQTLDENFPGLRQQGFPQAYAQVIRTGAPFYTEVVYGDERVVQSAFSVAAVPLPEQHMAVMFDNITQRKQAEFEVRRLNAELEERIAHRTAQLEQQTEALRRSETLYRTLAQNLPNGAVMLFDHDLRYLVAEGPALAHVAAAHEVMEGKTIWEVFPADVCSRLEPQYRAALAGGAICDERVVDEHIYQIYIHPIRDDQAYIVAGMVMVQDITERRRAEDAIRENVAWFRQLTASLFDGIAIFDQGIAIEANEQFAAMLGYSQAELLGQDVLTFFPASYHALVSHHVRTGYEQPYEAVMLRKDGTTFPAEIQGKMQHYRGRRVRVSTVRDITQRKQNEDERLALQEQIIAAQRAALRELSTPLIPITERVLIMPLIGNIDTQRAQMVMEAVLEGVARQQGELVILDITGVPIVDTQVAQALVQAAQAVKLLGAQVMLTGIQPAMAQTMVQLGIDLSGIITQGTLQQGVAYALQRRAR